MRNPKNAEIFEKLVKLGKIDPKAAIAMGIGLMRAKTGGWAPTEMRIVSAMSEEGLGGNNPQVFRVFAAMIGGAVARGVVTTEEVQQLMSGGDDSLNALTEEEYQQFRQKAQANSSSNVSEDDLAGMPTKTRVQ